MIFRYVKAKIAGLAAILSCLVFIGVPLQKSYANDINAVLIPEKNSALGTFNSQMNIELKYPADSPLAKELSNVNDRIALNTSGAAGSSTDVDSVLTAFNRAFIEANSPVQALNLTSFDYTAKIEGGPDTTIISYSIHAKPVLEKFVLTKDNQSGSSVLDLEWRKVTLKLPILLTSPTLGKVDVNHPYGILKAKYPDLAAKLGSTAANATLSTSLLDFSGFDVGMDRWHFLFDPTGNLVESSSYLRGNAISKIVSVYSLGESSFREGTFVANVKDVPITVDGASVNVHSEVPPPSGQISITGYSTVTNPGQGWIAQISQTAPAGETSSGGFPFQVLLVFGGMMGAIAIFILFKARK